MVKELSLKAQVAEVVILLVPLLVLGAVSWWFLSKRSAINREEALQAAAVGGPAGRRPTNSELRDARRRERERLAAAAAEAAADADGSEGSGDEDGDGQPRLPGAGRMKKKSAKEMKRELRAFQEQQRITKEEKEDKRRMEQEEREADKDEARKQREEEEAEELAKIKKAEQEEYDSWKGMFSTDESGNMETEVAEESQGLLQEFIEYIKAHKVVVLEELASHFKLRTEQAIARVRDMIEAEYITGVLDDRGKFIYISEEEMERVAKYINKKGRVTISDLAAGIAREKLIVMKDETE
jgi:hypothetical protein